MEASAVRRRPVAVAPALRRALLAPIGLCLLAAAGPALAAERMMSFDPESADAKRLTGNGLTVVFRTLITSQKVIKVMATAVPAVAELNPASESALGSLRKASLGSLYAVNDKADQGAAYVRAFCPGSKRLWLSFNRVSRYPLQVRAFGDDPKAGGQLRQCADMTFSFRGEWALPGRGPPDPMEDDHVHDKEPF